MLVAIVQARLGSNRLPGKSLMEIDETPLLGHLMRRLQACAGFDISYIAAPMKDADEINDRLYLKRARVIGVDGDENDVWARFVAVLEQTKPETFIRICGDSPLIDPHLIDWMIEQHEGGITCNTHPRTFPAGQCIEIFDTDIFLSGKPETPYDREHVTPWYYRNCKYKNVVCPDGDFSNVSMVVDTLEDFNRIEGIIRNMTREHWTYGWRDIVGMMK